MALIQPEHEDPHCGQDTDNRRDNRQHLVDNTQRRRSGDRPGQAAGRGTAVAAGAGRAAAAGAAVAARLLQRRELLELAWPPRPRRATGF